MTSDTSKAWIVFDYELDQLRAMCELLRVDNPVLAVLNLHLQNAIAESALIHTRIVIGILLPDKGEDGDIKINHLAPSFDAESCSAIARLDTTYGKRKDKTSHRYSLNRRLAHATLDRMHSHDWTPTLNALVPIIFEIAHELEAHRPLPAQSDEEV